MISTTVYEEMREISKQLSDMEEKQEFSDQFDQMKAKMGRFLTMIYMECCSYILKTERFSLSEFQLGGFGSIRFREEGVFNSRRYFYIDCYWGWENNHHAFRIPKNKIIG